MAIRTLTLGAGQRSGLWQGEMGIGAGIVIDSDATAEFAECQLKARFLTGLEPGFALFETMLLEGGAIRHVDRHLSRFRSSAAALGFKFEEQKVRNALAAQVRARPQGTAHRVRLQLEFDGRIESRAAPAAAGGDDRKGEAGERTGGAGHPAGRAQDHAARTL